VKKGSSKVGRTLTISLVGFIFIALYFLYIGPQIQTLKQNVPASTAPSTSITSPSLTTPYYNFTTTLATSISSTTSSASSTSTQHVNLTRLISYALEVVNRDRVGGGLKPVALGENSAAQSHAEDLAALLCLSHWGSNGMKPYMRYTLFGGKFFVEENVAAVFMFGRTTLPSEEEMMSFIDQLENEMMYNDAASDWGHRRNILDPAHTHVNIGIAYNSQIFVLVQDFENILIGWSEFSVKNTTVVMKGRFLQNLRSYMVLVYYDPPPSPLSREELMRAPYNESYGLGEPLGAILSRGYTTSLPYIYATRWSQNGLDFEIVFDFKGFVERRGVYTIVLEVEDRQGKIYFATSYSTFVG